MELDIKEIHSSTIDFCSKAKHELLIYSAFIKRPELKKLLDATPVTVKVTIIARWRFFDLLTGASDIDAWLEAKEHGAQFLVNPRLHLKVLVRDASDMYFGSANITGRGLGLVDGGNIEEMAYAKISSTSLEELRAIASSCEQIDDTKYHALKKLVCDNEKWALYVKKAKDEARKLENEKEKILKLQTIASRDFPLSASPEGLLAAVAEGNWNTQITHDAELFGITPGTTSAELRKAFNDSRCCQWQNTSLQLPASFGDYSAQLHAQLADGAQLRREVVKMLVRNMFNWTGSFVDDLSIDRPNYSEVMKRRS